MTKTIKLTHIATAVTLAASLTISIAVADPVATTTDTVTQAPITTGTTTGAQIDNIVTPNQNQTIQTPSATATQMPTNPAPTTTNPNAITATPVVTPIVNGTNPTTSAPATATTPVTSTTTPTSTTPSTGTAAPASTNVTTTPADTTNANAPQAAAIPQATLTDFAQKAAVAAFSYSYQNYQQSLRTMQSYFTKSGWDAFNKALASSNNLDVVQKEKLTVSATLNGQAEVTQNQQTATGQNWQVTVPVIVTYQNDKNQTVQQDLTVKLLIVTVSTDVNPSGIGIAQFIAMPNVAPTPAPAT